ncbi:hypothetical protein C480_11169 [Natrialba aegyptia DSM 13077]|uniref:Uncharacterized protein n=2 Tax=Natrialba aegyptia TaxID=129789 RepID=M0B3P9_9EURY|nr:hypothetical protein C480_11169 [Natrialba aegyptia DSM 13077]
MTDTMYNARRGIHYTAPPDPDGERDDDDTTATVGRERTDPATAGRSRSDTADTPESAPADD